MDCRSNSLIDQLHSTNETLASFARVIKYATELLTKGSVTHDFFHSEAVNQRLSELLPESAQFGLNAVEVFMLISTAYLHDIGHAARESNKTHGECSAHIISQDDSLKYLFPATDIKNQIAKLCYYHYREIEELNELEAQANLDIRPSFSIKREAISVRPRMLGAIFRLADELECTSDRMIGQPKDEDPRTSIAGVRLDLESRLVAIDFRFGSKEDNCRACKHYLSLTIERLNPFLDPCGLSFKTVDKLPERKATIQEEEGDDTQPGNEELPAVVPSNELQREPHNLDDLIRDYENGRLTRVDSIILELQLRGDQG